LGGKLIDGAPLYRCVMEQEHDKVLSEMEQYRAAGYKYFKLRVGIHPQKDIELIRFAAEIAKPGEVVYADANCRWTLDEAMKVVRAVKDLDVMIEQPCLTYEDCMYVRSNTNQSIKLDELVTDQSISERIIQDKAADVACVKMSRIGGLTKARRIRDLFVDQDIKVVTECMMGGEIVSAAVSHFAASTPAELMFNTADLHAYFTESTGTPPPPTSNGRIYCNNSPELGVEPDFDSLGNPVVVFG
jgi:L-alanine-DL-glutamate epimerase-like enolase superfamily enzyme